MWLNVISWHVYDLKIFQMVAGCRIILYHWKSPVTRRQRECRAAVPVSVFSMSSLLCRQFRHDRLEGRILGNVCYHQLRMKQRNVCQRQQSTLSRWGQDSSALSFSHPFRWKLTIIVTIKSNPSKQRVPACPIPGWFHFKWSAPLTMGH